MTGPLLESLVFRHCGARRAEVVLGPAAGEDAAALDLAGDLCVVASDPITGADQHAGWLAVHVNSNDVAATGAEPVAALLTILLPEGATAATLESIMAGAEAGAREVGCQIVGGHTEVTPGLAQPLVVATVLGRTPAHRLVPTGGAKPGDHLVLTKWAGLEGTAVLANDFRASLSARGVDGAVLEAAARLSRWISVLPEARVATQQGAHAMHDVTEGGVLGAVWELLEAASAARGGAMGCHLDGAAIPVRPETLAICGAAGIDPLRLIGSGALLVATDRADRLVGALREMGIAATIIGQITQDPGRWLQGPDGHRRPLEPPATDELWLARQRLAAAGSGGTEA